MPTAWKDRFWSKVALPDDRGCMLWTAGTTNGGYGMFRIGGNTVGAHRLSYEILVGDIPDGLEIDHLCRVRNCVAPGHMDVVSHVENMARSTSGAQNSHRALLRTHCRNGHAFTPENTAVGNNRNGPTGRRCKTCARNRKRAS